MLDEIDKLYVTAASAREFMAVNFYGVILEGIHLALLLILLVSTLIESSVSCLLLL